MGPGRKRRANKRRNFFICVSIARQVLLRVFFISFFYWEAQQVLDQKTGPRITNDSEWPGQCRLRDLGRKQLKGEGQNSYKIRRPYALLASNFVVAMS